MKSRLTVASHSKAAHRRAVRTENVEEVACRSSARVHVPLIAPGRPISTPCGAGSPVASLRAVENRESNDAGSLLSVSDRHLADHDVFLGNYPVHIEAPAAGVRRIPRLNRCEIFSPDDALARARPVDLAVLREVTGRTVPVILLYGSPERLDSGTTRHDREHRATTAPMWWAARLGQCSGMAPNRYGGLP